MRMWSLERQTGSIELLMSLAVSAVDAVLAKFLAAWMISGFALALTFPLVLTVNYLGISVDIPDGADDIARRVCALLKQPLCG